MREACYKRDRQTVWQADKKARDIIDKWGTRNKKELVKKEREIQVDSSSRRYENERKSDMRCGRKREING